MQNDVSFENKIREPGLSAEPVLQPVQMQIQTQVGNCGLPCWTADFEHHNRLLQLEQPRA